MRTTLTRYLARLAGLAACVATTASTAASAGGFAVAAQSAQFQGSAFAGTAAGAGLSSAFWNSAAIAEAGWGVTSESHYVLFLPDAPVTALPGSVVPPGTSLTTDVDRVAIAGAGYGAYRLNAQTVLGIAINSPFGLGTEADDPNWAGQYHGRSSKAVTVNVNPVLAFNVAPGLAVGIGAQTQYADLKFRTAPSGLPPNHPSAGLNVDDIGFGATAGVLWQPQPGTSIGLGYRSAIRHTLRGDSFIVGNSVVGLPFAPFKVEADVVLPEQVTLSMRQAVSPGVRVLGTVEWTNWSRLATVDFVATSPGGIGGVSFQPGDLVSRFAFNWHDGWVFALGGEYDWSASTTLRAGVSYQISPIRKAEERFTLIPDSDLVVGGVGATYKYNETLSFDISYNHVFFKDAPINRALTDALAPIPLVAVAEPSLDIIGVSMKIKWGGP
jgi:long-chain fatty acid transport protein